MQTPNEIKRKKSLEYRKSKTYRNWESFCDYPAGLVILSRTYAGLKIKLTSAGKKNNKEFKWTKYEDKKILSLKVH